MSNHEFSRKNYLSYALGCTAAILLLGFMTHNFLKNDFAIGPDRCFRNFQKDSEMSVRSMVTNTAVHGLWSSYGFMYRSEPGLENQFYLSAFGLQGKFFSWLYQQVRGNYDDFFLCCQAGMAFVAAAMFLWFIIFCWREFGPAAALSLAIFLNLSDWLVYAARNIYLVYIFHLFPFMLSFLLFPKKQLHSHSAWWRYFAFVSGAVLLKSLCYLDYSSNIVLSTACAPIYFGLKNGVAWRRIASWSFAIIALSSLAVILTIAATGIQSGIALGSLSDGFHQLFDSATSRAYGDSMPEKSAPEGMSLAEIWAVYLAEPVFSWPWTKVDSNGYWPFRHALWFYRYYVSFSLAIFWFFLLAAIALADKRFLPGIDRQRPTILALVATTFWGLLATTSWGWLMKGHMAGHFHMNGMIFYIPFALLLYLLFGKILGAVLSSWRK